MEQEDLKIKDNNCGYYYCINDSEIFL